MEQTGLTSDAPDADDPKQPVTFLLSRDEVLAILVLIGVDTLPSLGPDPLPDLTPEQRAVALIAGERALRARDLAIVDAEGHLRVQNNLLRLIATSAFPVSSLFVTCVDSPSAVATQMIVHTRDAHWALHRPLEAALHAFQLADSWPSVLELVAAFAGWPADAHGGAWSLYVSEQQLRAARELAAAGDIARAAEALDQVGPQSEPAQSLAHLLSLPHRVCVLQHIRPAGSGDIALSSVTVLQRDQQLLAAVIPAGEPENKYHLQPVDLAQLKALLTSLVTA